MWLLLPAITACIPFPKLSALALGRPDPTPPTLRLVLAGDGGVEAGDGRRGDPGLLPGLTLAMRQAAQSAPKSEVVWLGDNVYERGVEPGPEGAAAALRVLAPQITAAPRPEQVSFVPGNHDYLQFAVFGQRLSREGALIEAAGAHARAYGPPVERVPIGGTPFVLLYVDSERGIEDSAGARATILAAITRESFAGTVPIVLAHHPVANAGKHGKPTLAAVLQTELANPQYRTYAADVVGALRGRDAIFVAGHEHAVSVLSVDDAPGNVVQIVSGSAAKGHLGPPSANPLLDVRPGFVTLDLYSPLTPDAPARAGITAWFLQPLGVETVVTESCAAIAGDTGSTQLCSRGTAWVNFSPVTPGAAAP